ncbi:hypothetical protein [Nocardiopsis synnemataformans]|uniref:hypothetical protein n=1 Tax=Nocardiopsis synnemataformans TaxID=61305 RepID=UPI003EBCC061
MTDEQWAARQAREKHERDLMRRAARRLRVLAAGAPEGPYTVDPNPIRGYNLAILAGDGDPIGATRPWAGGIGDDTGSAEQTAAHLAVWDREAATATAALLEGLDAGMGMWAPFHPHEPGHAPWTAALTLARRVLNEPTAPTCS